MLTIKRLVKKFKDLKIWPLLSWENKMSLEDLVVIWDHLKMVASMLNHPQREMNKSKNLSNLLLVVLCLNLLLLMPVFMLPPLLRRSLLFLLKSNTKVNSLLITVWRAVNHPCKRSLMRIKEELIWMFIMMVWRNLVRSLLKMKILRLASAIIMIWLVKVSQESKLSMKVMLEIYIMVIFKKLMNKQWRDLKNYFLNSKKRLLLSMTLLLEQWRRVKSLRRVKVECLSAIIYLLNLKFKA